MRFVSCLVLLVCMTMLSLTESVSARTIARWLQEPLAPPQCVKNPFTVSMEFVKPNGNPDNSLDGSTYYLDLAPPTGGAYLDDGAGHTTQGGNRIPTTVVGNVATWTVSLVNGDPTKLYRLIASDSWVVSRCDDIYSCWFTPCPSGGFGDPQFVGLQGQSYQVHGRPDTLFNLISWPSHGFALNSEFVYLAQGQCNYNNTECWSHPGTYFGKMGLLINNSTRVLINSGSHLQGLSVYVNDKHQKQSDEAIVVESSSVHVVDYDRVEIRTPDFLVTLVNSDMFLNMQLSLLDKALLQSGLSKNQFQSRFDAPTGLLGQTWQLKEYVSATGVKRPYKGTTDDYIVDTPFEFMH